MEKFIIVSDVHINSYYSKWRRFVDLIDTLEADVLILNGDIYDLYLGKPKHFIFDRINLNNKIKNFIFIPGNHDYNIKDYFPDLETKNSFESGDLLVMHGHIKDSSETYKPSWFSKYICIARNWIEETFNFNFRIFLKTVSFGYLDKYLFKQNIQMAEKYKDKKVVIGHTHLPINNPPYYNCGCMTDDYFSYIEVTLSNGISSIKLVSEKD